MLYKYILIFKKNIFYFHFSLGLNNNDDLIRIIVSRCEIDLEFINREYTILYRKSLEEAIYHELSGNYRVKIFFKY